MCGAPAEIGTKAIQFHSNFEGSSLEYTTFLSTCNLTIAVKQTGKNMRFEAENQHVREKRARLWQLRGTVYNRKEVQVAMEPPPFPSGIYLYLHI